MSHVFDLLFSWSTLSDASRLVQVCYHRSIGLHPVVQMEAEDGYRYARSSLHITADDPPTKVPIVRHRDGSGGYSSSGEDNKAVRVVLTSMWRVLHRTALRCFEWERGFCLSDRGEGAGIALCCQPAPLTAKQALSGTQIYKSNGYGSGGGGVSLKDIIQDFAYSGDHDIDGIHLCINNYHVSTCSDYSSNHYYYDCVVMSFPLTFMYAYAWTHTGIGRLPRSLSFHLPLHRSLTHCILECTKHHHLTSNLVGLQQFMKTQAKQSQLPSSASASASGFIGAPLSSATTMTINNTTWDHLWGTCTATMEVPLFSIILASQIKVLLSLLCYNVL